MWPDKNSTTNLAIKMYNYFFSSRNNLLKLSDKIFKMDFFLLLLWYYNSDYYVWRVFTRPYGGCKPIFVQLYFGKIKMLICILYSPNSLKWTPNIICGWAQSWYGRPKVAKSNKLLKNCNNFNKKFFCEYTNCSMVM